MLELKSESGLHNLPFVPSVAALTRFLLHGDCSISFTHLFATASQGGSMLSRDLVYRLCLAAISGQFTATGLSQSARLVIHRLHILSALAFRNDARFQHSSFQS